MVVEVNLSAYTTLIILKSAIVRIIVPKAAREVVVSFESAANDVDRKDKLRAAFGEKFLLENNFAVIGIMPHFRTWYRTPDIHSFIESIEVRDFLATFQRIHTYGASMGGYGACAFAQVLGAHNVVAFQPISTLAAHLVPWETRFRWSAEKHDWMGPYHDAAKGLMDVESAWIIHDPGCPDKIHGVRLAQGADTASKIIYVHGANHSAMGYLSKRAALKAVVLACLRGASCEEVQHIVDGCHLYIPETSVGETRHPIKILESR